jgi:ferrochelatase
VADAYDAVLIVSFGGPEGPDDVLPFLENVLAGKPVPRERMLEVAEHYRHFGGRSPLNELNRALAAALSAELEAHGPPLPVYWGNRNWHPLLDDTVRQMTEARVRRALAFVTSAYSSYSSCRQYLENIEHARRQAGARAPRIEKLRTFYNHPTFIEAWIERARDALAQVPSQRQAAAHLVYTAHSIPRAMADASQYVAQLEEASRLVSDALGTTRHHLAYQSRSGPPQQPWLEPDIGDALEQLHDQGVLDVVVVPIGFLSEHIEILWDLDTAARGQAQKLGINMIRAATVGSHPAVVRMIRELILERTAGSPRRAVGKFGPSHDECPSDCCAYGTPTRKTSA